MKASKVLLTTKICQTDHTMACEDGKMCATGILAHAMGFDLQDLLYRGSIPRMYKYESNSELRFQVENSRNMFFSAVMSEYGLTQKDWDYIIQLNDEGSSLQDIGYWLELNGL